MNTLYYDDGVKRQSNLKRGYMALMATIIISVILLVMTVEESSAGWYLRFNILGTEAKEQANALAEGCADQALALIVTNPGYVGDENITSEGGMCHVYPIEFNTPTPGLVTIKTQAEVRDAYANLEISMNMADIHLGTPLAGKGTLVVVTQVINDGIGSAASSAFSMQVVATNPSQSTFSGSDTGVVVTMDVGAYIVTETPVVGYATTVSSNCSGTISAGQIKFCTITNDDILTSLTLIANVTNDNNGTSLPANFPLFIDGTPATLGTRYVVTAGAHAASATTLAGYAVSPWGYDCAAGGAVTVSTGQSKTCIISLDDLPPPAPSCADTVMILDRTGSMSSTDLTNERAAALALNNLYAGVLPPALPPHLGVGSIGGLDGSAASIPPFGQLSIIYANIASAITSITGSNSSVGSDLSAGITVASNELNSVRHVPGNEKVLVLVSDGDPNEPSGNVDFDTGWKSPTSIASPSAWTNPLNATSSNNIYATADDDNDDQGYRNFGFSVPSGVTIQGIEVHIEAFSSVVSTPATIFSDSFGTGNSDNTVGSGWSEGGSNSSSDGTIAKSPTGSTNDTASTDGGRFALIEGNDGYICRTINTASILNAQLSYYWRGDTDAEDNENGIIEYRTSGACNSGNGWTPIVTHELDNNNNNTAEVWAQNTVSIPSNNTLIIRFHSDSNTANESLRIDGVLVTGANTPLNTSCQIQARIGDSGSFSSYKSVTLTGTDTVFPPLGSSSDDWDNVTWSNGDFSDANFRLETRFNDPDANCDASAVATLDQLQARVHYTQNVDPIEAALNAADAAKLGDISLFTIHFGDDVGPYKGKKLLANLASGGDTVTGHQPGSTSNGGGGGSSNTGAISPTSQAATTGGDGNGFEVNGLNALTDGPSGLSGAAQNIDGAGDRHLFSGYNFGIPPGATIVGIQTRLDWWLDSSSGTNSLGVELSWNGGTSWSTTQSDTNESTNTSNNRTLGSASSLSGWGSHAWTVADFSTTNFRVRLTSNSTSSTRDFFLDWVPVTVYYTTASTENGDGDNFFVAPTSADMQSIFNFIGEQVCPAALNLASPPPPTTGTLLAITQVINNNGGALTPADFIANVSATSPSPASFAGSVSGVSVTVNPGAYTITEASEPGYNEILGATCSSVTAGPIVAGETRVCVLTNDDIPPPPPPPDFNIDTGNWQEVPTSS